MNLRQQLSRDEGRVLHAYKDSLGYWTVGVGHLIDPSKGATPPIDMTRPDGPDVISIRCTITDEVCDRLLDDDIANKTQRLTAQLPWLAILDDARRGVLLNMAFNLGVSGVLAFKDTLHLIQIGQYHAASLAMLKSKWATQVGSRANRLARQMDIGVWQ